MLPCRFVDFGERDVYGWNTIVEFHCLLTICQSFLNPLRVRTDFIFQPVSLAELCVAQSKPRICLQRAFQRGDSLVEIPRLVISLHQTECAQVSLVCRGSDRSA